MGVSSHSQKILHFHINAQNSSNKSDFLNNFILLSNLCFYEGVHLVWYNFINIEKYFICKTYTT